MREKIKINLENPERLEALYRDNATHFKQAFNLLYPEISESATAQCWYARLNYEEKKISWGTNNDLVFVIISSLVAGLIAKIPDFLALNQDLFFQRNIGFIVFPLLSIYFAWKHKTSTGKIVIGAVLFLLSAIYVNALPEDNQSDTLILACIHLPLVLWATLGFTFIGDNLKSYRHRLDFLRYNGDLLVMTTLILISGALLVAVTFGLFQLIHLQIEKFYTEYVIVFGLAASPIFGTYLVQRNPELVDKVSPVIAKVFTPLVLITLIAYLIALVCSGKDPFNDRDFLMIFNFMLIGVMAIILFASTVTSKNGNGNIGILLLLLLSLVALIINAIALSAIMFRITEGGLTPNRLAVLGGNVLMLTNLAMVAYRLFRTMRKRDELDAIGNSIAYFLPIYAVWAHFMTFVVPVLYHFQ